MIGAGHILGHRDWAPTRKSDPGPFLVDEIRDWAPTAAPEEDDMSAADVQAINAHTTTKVNEVGALLEKHFGPSSANNPQAWVNVGFGNRITANVKALLAPLLAAISAAGVESGKRDAAVLATLAALPAPDVDADELAAELAPLLAEHGVDLSEATIARAVRTELAAALAGPAA